MASEQSPSHVSNSATLPPTSTAILRDNNAIKTRPLKRKRSETSNHSLNDLNSAGLECSTPLRSPQIFRTYSPGLTAINESEPTIMSEQRQDEITNNHGSDVSESCGNRILSSFIASDENKINRLQDVPSDTVTETEELKASGDFNTIPNTMSFKDKPDSRSTSLATLASLGNTISSVVLDDSTSVVNKSMSRDTRLKNFNQSQGSFVELLPKMPSVISEGVVVNQIQENGMVRSVSLQNPGQHLMPRSPSLKKHKCPYCETEFTRHHNLKSHLLTHSQEKPYTCQTCTMKFRRLHDLKRHTKLHTGERPHTCHKCDRKFARADALARHTKGQGGCAGRRASIGSFGGDDILEESSPVDGDENAMNGVIYGDSVSHHRNGVNEEERRRLSLPSMQTKHVFNPGNGEVYSSPRIPNSFPLIGTRSDQPPGGPHTPSEDRVNSELTVASPHAKDIVLREYTTGANLSSLPLSNGDSAAFVQNVMLESANPQSQNNSHSLQSGHDAKPNPQRSPSTNSQYPSHCVARQQSNKAPKIETQIVSPHRKSHGPKLPALAGLATVDQRYSVSNQASSQNSPGNELKAELSTPGALFSSEIQNTSAHLDQGGIDGNNNNLFASAEKEVWAYVQTLEDKVRQLSDKMQTMETKEKNQEDKINQLSLEIFSLRTQLNTSNPSLNLTGSSRS